MPRYRATLISGVSATVTVEADSAEEAYDTALFAAPAIDDAAAALRAVTT